MDLKKRRDGWWITNVPIYEADGREHSDYGPYTTKDEASSILRGLERTFKANRDIFPA